MTSSGNKFNDFPKKQSTKFHAEFSNFMQNLVWKHLKLIPLIQLGGLGERYKVPCYKNDCETDFFVQTAKHKMLRI